MPLPGPSGPTWSKREINKKGNKKKAATPFKGRSHYIPAAVHTADLDAELGRCLVAPVFADVTRACNSSIVGNTAHTPRRSSPEALEGTPSVQHLPLTFRCDID